MEVGRIRPSVEFSIEQRDDWVVVCRAPPPSPSLCQPSTESVDQHRVVGGVDAALDHLDAPALVRQAAAGAAHGGRIRIWRAADIHRGARSGVRAASWSAPLAGSVGPDACPMAGGWRKPAAILGLGEASAVAPIHLDGDFAKCPASQSRARSSRQSVAPMVGRAQNPEVMWRVRFEMNLGDDRRRGSARVVGIPSLPGSV